jgi:hypothetical protein
MVMKIYPFALAAGIGRLRPPKPGALFGKARLLSILRSGQQGWRRFRSPVRYRL